MDNDDTFADDGLTDEMRERRLAIPGELLVPRDLLDEYFSYLLGDSDLDEFLSTLRDHDLQNADVDFGEDEVFQDFLFVLQITLVLVLAVLSFTLGVIASR